MMSKLSFSSLLKEDRKHRQWVPVLAGVVYFIGLLVAIMILQQLYQDVRSSGYDLLNPNSYATRRIANLILGGENPALIAVSVIGALICGYEGFSYLLYSREVDYYHSLPVRRETHFAVKWINGFLFYIIPYAAFLVLATLFTAIFGLITDTFFTDLLIGLAENVIIFLLVYNLVILVIMLSGQPVIAGGGGFVVAIYALALRYVIPVYVDSFFDTYVNGGGGVLSKLEYLSPPILIFNMVVRNGIAYYIAAILIAAAAMAAAYFCYKKRPLEAAGSALAFPVMKPIIRFLLVLPATLYITWGFIELAPAAKIVWAVVSAIVFTVLLHAIIEILFEFDLKAAFNHKAQLAACAVISILFVCFFLADPMDMDHRIPSKESVDEIYVNMYTGKNNYVDENDTGSWPSFMYGETYAMEHIKVTGENKQLVYNLIGKSKNYDDLRGEKYETIRVNFKMKNGMIQERRFNYGILECSDEIEALFSCDEFRSMHYQIGTLPVDKYSKMYIEDAASRSFDRQFTKEEIASFMEIYRSEQITRDAMQELTETPLGIVRLFVELAELPSYTIYSCDTASIAWLKAHDIDLMNWLDSEEVVGAVVRKLTDRDSEDYEYKVSEYYKDGYYEEAYESYDDKVDYFQPSENVKEAEYYDSEMLDSFYSKIFWWEYPVEEIWVVNNTDELSMLTPYLRRFDYLESDNYQLFNIAPRPEYVMEITFRDARTGNITVESYVTDAQHLPKDMKKLDLQ